ncbi:MAG: outer membrane protein assembly factor BamE [Gammaproteobacteria bacterium]|nr:outer membrane protein assembly factor BamE [Gammaproteobacteria bacterium]
MDLLKLRHYGFIFIILLLAGCVTTIGRSFQKLEAPQIIPGETTAQDIIGLLGEPTTKNTLNPGTAYNYIHHNRNAKAVNPDEVATRFQTFNFNNKDILTGYQFGSSFVEDSTLFNTDNVKKISNGDSKSQVLRVMGSPSGIERYPRDPKYAYVLVYSYPTTTHSDSTFRMVNSVVNVVFGHNEQVVRVETFNLNTD